MTEHVITYGSLFSGIGGFDLGFEQAGLACRWQVEIDDRARAVLDNRWPNITKYEDVRNVGAANLEPVGVICGGFPCQDLSVAGKRGGLAGEQSGLWYEFHRIVTELKPGWVVIENVPGLLSSNGGRDFAVILSGLAECGYLSAWRVLDAQYFGLAQRRKRVFIVASLGNGNAAKVLFESEGGCWNPPPGRETRPGFAAAITERTRDAGRTLEMQDDLAYALTNPGSGGRSHSRLVAFGGNNTQGSIDRATAVNAHSSRRYDFESETFVCNTFNGYTGGADDNDAQGWHIVPALAEILNSGGNEGGFRTEPGAHIIAPKVISNGVRRLTPVECERLQGFPDGWTGSQADSARYRQLGNAVAVPVARWIGEKILEAGNA